jgi:hypothetical protein
MAGRPTIASEYISMILRAIEQTQNDPAQLRSLVYDVARLSLGKHVLTNYRQLGSDGLQQHVKDLETAIEQVEQQAQKTEAPADSADPLLLDRSVGPAPKHTALVVRDAFGDSLFDEAWSKKTDLVVRQASAEVYRDDAGPIQILRPTEIWQPAFGRGPKPKHSRADFLWGIQLASAALIGVGIYVVMLMRSNPFIPGLNYSVAAPVTQGVAVASLTPTVSGLRPAVAPATTASTGGASQSLGFPLPSVYGVYAVSQGKLYELDQLAMRVPDPRVRISAMIADPSHVTVPDGKLSFVIFRRDLAASAPVDVFVRVIAQVQLEMKFNGGGPPTTTKVAGEWAVRSKSYEFRVAPLADKPEMIVLRAPDSDFTLPAGRYALVLGGQGYDFVVAGQVTDLAHCLESSNVIGGMVYSECPTLASSPTN